MDSQRGQRGHDFLPADEALSTIPGAYESQHVPAEDKTIWLHYFSAASDHYLTEAWYEPGQEGEPGQWMAFGYARLAAFPARAEWGYINLDELEQLRAEGPRGVPVIVERDLSWEPKKFSQIVPAHKEPGNPGRDLAPRPGPCRNRHRRTPRRRGAAARNDRLLRGLRAITRSPVPRPPARPAEGRPVRRAETAARGGPRRPRRSAAR